MVRASPTISGVLRACPAGVSVPRTARTGAQRSLAVGPAASSHKYLRTVSASNLHNWTAAADRSVTSTPSFGLTTSRYCSVRQVTTNRSPGRRASLIRLIVIPRTSSGISSSPSRTGRINPDASKAAAWSDSSCRWAEGQRELGGRSRGVRPASLEDHEPQGSTMPQRLGTGRVRLRLCAQAGPAPI